MYIYIKVKWSCYRPGVAQKVGRGITLLFHDRGTRRGWVVSSKPRPHFTPGKDPMPVLKEAGWAPGPVWTEGKSRPHRDSIPDRPAHSQSLYRLSYPAHTAINKTLICTNRNQSPSAEVISSLSILTTPPIYLSQETVLPEICPQNYIFSRQLTRQLCRTLIEATPRRCATDSTLNNTIDPFHFHIIYFHF